MQNSKENTLLLTREKIFGKAPSKIDLIAQAMFVGYMLHFPPTVTEEQLSTVTYHSTLDDYDKARVLFVNSYKAYRTAWNRVIPI